MAAVRAVDGVATGRRPAQQYAAASKWPLVMGGLAFAFGTALAIWTALSSQPQPLFGNSTVPFAAVATLPLSIGGYVLTPLVVFAALLWDRLAQRLGLRDRNFALRPAYSRTLQWLSVGAMIVGIWHVLNIAYAASSA